MQRNVKIPYGRKMEGDDLGATVHNKSASDKFKRGAIIKGEELAMDG